MAEKSFLRLRPSSSACRFGFSSCWLTQAQRDMEDFFNNIFLKCVYCSVVFVHLQHFFVFCFVNGQKEKIRFSLAPALYREVFRKMLSKGSEVGKAINYICPTMLKTPQNKSYPEWAPLIHPWAHSFLRRILNSAIFSPSTSTFCWAEKKEWKLLLVCKEPVLTSAMLLEKSCAVKGKRRNRSSTEDEKYEEIKIARVQATSPTRWSVEGENFLQLWALSARDFSYDFFSEFLKATQPIREEYISHL